MQNPTLGTLRRQRLGGHFDFSTYAECLRPPGLCSHIDFLIRPYLVAFFFWLAPEVQRGLKIVYTPFHSAKHAKQTVAGPLGAPQHSS